MSLPTLLSQHIVRRPQRIALLQHIAEQGSITRAAKSAGLSYKAAWDAIATLPPHQVDLRYVIDGKCVQPLLFQSWKYPFVRYCR